jgi:hypothetical protein
VHPRSLTQPWLHIKHKGIYTDIRTEVHGSEWLRDEAMASRSSYMILQQVGRHKKRPRIPEGFPDSEVAKIQEVLNSNAAESIEDDLEQIPPKQ